MNLDEPELGQGSVQIRTGCGKPYQFVVDGMGRVRIHGHKKGYYRPEFESMARTSGWTILGWQKVRK